MTTYNTFSFVARSNHTRLFPQMTTARQKRLSESRRYLTKLLIIASTIKHNMPINIVEIDPISTSEREEAEDLVKHGSLHIPELLVNVHNISHFGKFVVGWSRLSTETGILDIVKAGERGHLIVGLPNNREIMCIMLESEIANQFEKL